MADKAMTPSGTPTPAPIAMSLLDDDEEEEEDASVEENEGLELPVELEEGASVGVEQFDVFADVVGVVTLPSRLDMFARAAYPGIILPSGIVKGSAPSGQVTLPSLLPTRLLQQYVAFPLI